MLSGKVLGASIWGAIKDSKDPPEKVWEKISEEIIKHITTNAMVMPTGSPPMIAPPNGGPVTGMGKIQ